MTISWWQNLNLTMNKLLPTLNTLENNKCGPQQQRVQEGRATQKQATSLFALITKPEKYRNGVVALISGRSIKALQTRPLPVPRNLIVCSWTGEAGFMSQLLAIGLGAFNRQTPGALYRRHRVVFGRYV
jgi:hypothetical protein